MRKTVIATLALAAVGLVAGSANAQSVVCQSGEVTADTTWSGEVILPGACFVKDGATLSILANTVVRGQPRTGPVTPGVTAGTPGALIVTQTGRIEAQGTPQQPVIFTTAAVDNNNDGVADDVSPADGFDDPWDPGDTFLDDDPRDAPLAPLDKNGNANISKWGGIAILGNAPTNLADRCTTSYGTCVVEGLTIPGFPVSDATYGGLQPHDSSGIMEFVSIRHAGDEIGEGNELNCLTIAGVGDATRLSHVECYANFDDGFEWFGGTVDGDHLAAFFIGDDTFDIDQGYTGVNQFLFGIVPFFTAQGGAFGSASGDKAGEWDGDDLGERGGDANIRLQINSAVSNNRAWPFHNPSTWNMTIMGNAVGGGACFTPTNGDVNGIQMRNGYAGEIYNSIIVNTGSQKGIVISGGGVTTAASHANAGLISVVSSTLDDTAALAAIEQTVINNGNAKNASRGGTANVVNGLFNGLVQEDITFNPMGNAAGKLAPSLACNGPINPRPAAGLVGVAGGVPPTIPGLEDATFRGAFDRGANVLWTTGWTTLNRAGLLAD